METLTVKQLIKELKKVPGDLPAYVTIGMYNPLHLIDSVQIHIYEDKVMIKGTEKLKPKS